MGQRTQPQKVVSHGFFAVQHAKKGGGVTVTRPEKVATIFFECHCHMRGVFPVQNGPKACDTTFSLAVKRHTEA